jgi:hypothetical protein
MGTFSEMDLVDYLLLIANLRKNKLSLTHFCLQQQNGGCSFLLVPFSVCGNMETWRHGNMETWRHGNLEMETWKHGDIDTETWKHGDNGDMET